MIRKPVLLTTFLVLDTFDTRQIGICNVGGELSPIVAIKTSRLVQGRKQLEKSEIIFIWATVQVRSVVEASGDFGGFGVVMLMLLHKQNHLLQLPRPGFLQTRQQRSLLQSPFMPRSYQHSDILIQLEVDLGEYLEPRHQRYVSADIRDGDEQGLNALGV